MIALLALVLYRRLRALPPTDRPQICLSDAAQRVGLRIGSRPTGSSRKIALPLPQRTVSVYTVDPRPVRRSAEMAVVELEGAARVSELPSLGPRGAL